MAGKNVINIINMFVDNFKQKAKNYFVQLVNPIVQKRKREYI